MKANHHNYNLNDKKSKQIGRQCLLFTSANLSFRYKDPDEMKSAYTNKSWYFLWVSFQKRLIISRVRIYQSTRNLIDVFIIILKPPNWGRNRLSYLSSLRRLSKRVVTSLDNSLLYLNCWGWTELRNKTVCKNKTLAKEEAIVFWLRRC